MARRNRKAACTRTTPLRGLAGVCLISLGLSGCAFFDQPVDDLGSITPGAPPSSSTLPPPLPDSGTTPPRLPNSTDASTGTPPPLNAPDASVAATGTLPTLRGQGTYLTVSSLIDIPEDATNLAFVHFTTRDSARALAVCQATMKNLPLVAVDNIPAGADTVLVWPVNNSDVGNSCLEMISNYEALDISNATSQRVNESARGPFVLTRNSRQGKRLIYDLSFIDRNKFVGAIDEWRSLLGSDPANWPEYRPAR